jgi:hypothetical protein
MPKSAPISVRVLQPSEYPESITQRQGAFTPDVRFAAIHPLGMYYVDHEGAGSLAAYFIPKRKGSRVQNAGRASSLQGALAKISRHEDNLVNPDAPRERGANGPVSIYSLGERTKGEKTKTELDLEIDKLLLRIEGRDPHPE